MPWPDKKQKPSHSGQKINFLDNYEFESSQSPGPGSYLIATHIAKKVKQFHHTVNKPLQPITQVAADMGTYEPIPLAYSTFKRYEKMGKVKSSINLKREEQKPNKENQSSNVPGPGHYQMINTWLGKDSKANRGSFSYLNKVSKGFSHGVYN